MPNEGRPENIVFVGAGNMASAIIGGLIDSGYSPSRIGAADPSARAKQSMRALNVTRLADSPAELTGDADLIVLAVKPQIMAEVARSIQGHLNPTTLVMSVAAGITAADLATMLGNPDQPVVRCMPNTPALVRTGASGLFASDTVTDTQRNQVEAVMRGVGTTLWVEQESLLEAVTAVSGSGPAYFFAFMEAMIAKGESLGLSHDQASALTLQTALGAARLASEQNVPIDVLRSNVTSPGGTTERALATFAAEGLPDIVDHAMQACVDRAVAMAEEFKA